MGFAQVFVGLKDVFHSLAKLKIYQLHADMMAKGFVFVFAFLPPAGDGGHRTTVVQGPDVVVEGHLEALRAEKDRGSNRL